MWADGCTLVARGHGGQGARSQESGAIGSQGAREPGSQGAWIVTKLLLQRSFSQVLGSQEIMSKSVTKLLLQRSFFGGS